MSSFSEGAGRCLMVGQLHGSTHAMMLGFHVVAAPASCLSHPHFRDLDLDKFFKI
jgi:hypothetical protein